MQKLSPNARVVCLGVVCLAVIGIALPSLAEESSTKNDPSLTPWNDPDDPYVIRLNREDAPPDAFFERNEKQDRSIRGPIDLNRYKGGHAYDTLAF